MDARAARHKFSRTWRSFAKPAPSDTKTAATETRSHVASLPGTEEHEEYHPVDENPDLPVNDTIFEAFEWYLPGSTGYLHHPDDRSQTGLISHWTRLRSLLPTLAQLGLTSILLPPACKATSVDDQGYGIYDLYDLGEFEAKGTVRTKWGTKEELAELCRAASHHGIGVVFDAVLNHRGGSDGTELCKAVKVLSVDRRVEEERPRTIEAWTQFNYSTRNGRHSGLRYNKDHFSGIDWDQRSQTNAIYKFVGPHKKGWAKDVDPELGNYDYLMFADVDYSNPEVRADVLHWGAWLVGQLPGLTGIRLDAIKHYSASFQRELIRHVDHATPAGPLFWVGEYWKADSKLLSKHIDHFGGRLHLFDVKLVYNLHEASCGKMKDLRKIFKGSLVDLRPEHAVTFVANHDTQEHQSLAAPVEPWFVAHAYALILLRAGGTPSVFWGDVYGTAGPRPREPACGGRLSRLLLARRWYAYGEQTDYFDDGGCIGWTRSGRSPSPASSEAGTGVAVVVSRSWSWKKKRMYVGTQHAHSTWTDLMGWAWEPVKIDPDGFGVFPVGQRSMGVWTRKNGTQRQVIDGLSYPLPVESEETTTL